MGISRVQLGYRRVSYIHSERWKNIPIGSLKLLLLFQKMDASYDGARI